MRYLSESDVTQMMGIGHLGEVRQGPDGNLYQWVEGIDGLGNPIGFWRGLRKRLKKVVSRALPLAQKFAPFIPGASAALTMATPFLKQAGVAGYESIGALYEAPDGSLYQVQGLAEDEELRGIDENEMPQMMGLGYLGEVRQGPDGNLYQWMQGVDGLGNPIGFWGKKLRSLARKALKYHPAAQALRAASPLLRKALPVAQQVASVIPGGAAALTAVTPIIDEAGVTGYEGIGALYQAPDGTLYQQVQGLAEDEELRGIDEDEELRGLDEDEELRGFGEDDELRGLDEDEELRGFAEDTELRGLEEDEELRGLEEDEELRGLEQGYIREPGTSGFEAYVPQTPPQTRWFKAPAQPPDMWKPLW